MNTFFSLINNNYQKSSSDDVETHPKSTFRRLPDFSYSPPVTSKRRFSQQRERLWSISSSSSSPQHNDATDSCSIKSSSTSSSATSLSSFDDSSISENKYVSFPSFENFASDCCWYDNEQRLLLKREIAVSELEMERYDEMFVGNVRT
ncbi:4961_t:CDS:1 [Ambispora leptoticha]|uniref:4961_t:CDS:1 n=1 Tax=Ambispora leptoticha TaxID=144679 RepID=A0A9N9A9F2_9GLOM|nr:4961_t:CDS:1 [Ambispora leptoticha]